MMIHAHETALCAMVKRDGTSFIDEDFDDVDEEVSAELASEVAQAYDRMAARLAASNAQALRAQGLQIDLRKGKLGVHIEHAREKNIRLVEAAQRQYADDVRDIFSDPDTYGLTTREISKKLVERGNVWQSRATLIARDQTLKLNSAITKQRHQDAGISQYTWSTSLDDRVRPEHEELEGTVQDWDSPPEPGHPGEDIQCRCVAIPILPTDEEDDDDS